jgi:hypothetical protein
MMLLSLLVLRHFLIDLVSLLGSVEHLHLVFHGFSTQLQEAPWNLVVRAHSFQLHNGLAFFTKSLEHSHHARHKQNLVSQDAYL